MNTGREDDDSRGGTRAISAILKLRKYKYFTDNAHTAQLNCDVSYSESTIPEARTGQLNRISSDQQTTDIKKARHRVFYIRSIQDAAFQSYFRVFCKLQVG